MRVVVYDDDTMEPITVLNLRGVTERDIEDRGCRWRVPVRPEMAVRFEVSECMPVLQAMRIVDLTFERLVRRTVDRRERRSWMCFTKQEELALLLGPDWLPGQRSTVNYLQSQNDRLTNIILNALAFRP